MDELELATRGTTKTRKAPVKWPACQTVCLLREVHHHKPYSVMHGLARQSWEAISDVMVKNHGMNVDHEAVRVKFFKLQKKFENSGMANLRKSGTEDDYRAMEQLLTTIKREIVEASQKRAKKTARETFIQAENKAGESLPSVHLSSDDDGIVRKRKKTHDLDLIMKIEKSKAVATMDLGERKVNAMMEVGKVKAAAMIEVGKVKAAAMLDLENKRLEWEKLKFEEKKREREVERDFELKKLELTYRIEMARSGNRSRDQ